MRKRSKNPQKTKTAAVQNLQGKVLRVPFDPPPFKPMTKLRLDIQFPLSLISTASPRMTRADVYSAMRILSGIVASSLRVETVSVWGPEPSDVGTDTPHGVGVQIEANRMTSLDYGTKTRRPATGLLLPFFDRNNWIPDDGVTIASFTDGRGEPLNRADDFNLYIVRVTGEMLITK